MRSQGTSLEPGRPKINDLAAAILVLSVVALIWGGVLFVAIRALVGGLL